MDKTEGPEESGVSRGLRSDVKQQRADGIVMGAQSGDSQPRYCVLCPHRTPDDGESSGNCEWVSTEAGGLCLPRAEP